MALIQGKCTNCGANIKFIDGTKKGVCNHCDAVYIAEDVINNYTTTQNITEHYHGNVYKVDVTKDVNVILQNTETLIKMGDWKAAEDKINRAIEIDATNVNVWFCKMRVCTQNFDDYSKRSAKAFRDIKSRITTLVELEDFDKKDTIFEYAERLCSLERYKERTRQKDIKTCIFAIVVATIIGAVVGIIGYILK